jgi:hypothetical protein
LMENSGGATGSSMEGSRAESLSGVRCYSLRCDACLELSTRYTWSHTDRVVFEKDFQASEAECQYCGVCRAKIWRL